MKKVNLIRKTCDNFNNSIKRLSKKDQQQRQEDERQEKSGKKTIEMTKECLMIQPLPTMPKYNAD